YSRRWAFKHPEPADFFRTIEDASGEDLDWFWRGWFYGTDAVDLSIDSVKYAKAEVSETAPRTTTRTVALDKPSNSVEDVSKIRNRTDPDIQFTTDQDTSLRDFYWRYARGLEQYDTTKYTVDVSMGSEKMTEEEKKKLIDKHFYELTFGNKGGLVMPIIIEWTYKDGTKEVDRIPAQIWRMNENRVKKFFIKDKEVASIKLDPLRETADINEANNTWGSITQEPSKFAVFKMKQAVRGSTQSTNPMQKAQEKKGF
ncbi:MAG: M1 family peptidase, partial [Flavisolibacter sp.]